MKAIVLLLVAAATSTVAFAQMYKWVDKDGKTHYTDSPPPQDAKNLAAPKGSSAPASPAASKGRGEERQASGGDSKQDGTQKTFQPSPTRVFDSALVGVRLTLPAEWPADDRTHDMSVNCAPRIESRPGMPGCYFTVGKRRLAAGQAEITDADRAKWRSGATADGMRPFVSAQDVKVAGYAAHEILVREGKERNAALTLRLFVLIPGRQVVDVMHYAYWDDKDQSAATRPAVRAALETLKPAK